MSRATSSRNLKSHKKTCANILLEYPNKKRMETNPNRGNIKRFSVCSFRHQKKKKNADKRETTNRPKNYPVHLINFYATGLR